MFEWWLVFVVGRASDGGGMSHGADLVVRFL